MFAKSYFELFNINISNKIPDYSEKWFKTKCKQIGMDYNKAINSAGTLGGGNHFLEIGSYDDKSCVTIHSGSRNLGKRICDYWQEQAEKYKYQDKVKKLIQEAVTQEQKKELQNKIKEITNADKMEKNLEYLTGDEAVEYLFDMIFAQEYARINRLTMLKLIQNIVKAEIIETIESVHNYIDFEDMIIRKGAIKSYIGQKMVIPFNMRDGILICEGKSNPEWNYSAPHGAGRVYSRSKAKQVLSLDQFKEEMKEVFSTSVGRSTLDESPMAYKDSKIIEQAIEPTAKILHRIKPIINLKDKSERITYSKRKIING
jgi:RNA-splicing ligase RtcB